MRKSFSSLLLFALCIGAGSVATAQQSSAAASPSGSGWERVMALKTGAKVSVQFTDHSASCKVVSVDAASLTCAGADAAKTVVYQKADIRKIKMGHRGRSAAVGMLIGAGVGAGVGVGVGESHGTTNNSILTTGDVAAIFAIGLAVIGAIVGLLTDFTSSTIYKG